jgi:DNA-binding response OmpR family regulator
MRVMIAEDDVALSRFLAMGLEMEGHGVTCVPDGRAALDGVLTGAPDLLVLDLGLPGMDGVDVLRALQNTCVDLAVVVLTGRGSVAHRIECLNLGADDYVVKPFSLQELLARCRAVARRRTGHCSGALHFGGLRLDRVARSVSLEGAAIDLTSREFALLEHLLQNRGRAVSRREVLNEVWRMGPESGTNVVDVYVNYLRKKLAGGGALIETVRGEGYAMGFRRGPVAAPLAEAFTEEQVA